MAIQQEADRRIQAIVPAADANAFKQCAEEHGRSEASELRLAIKAWLKQNGRRAK